MEEPRAASEKPISNAASLESSVAVEPTWSGPPSNPSTEEYGDAPQHPFKQPNGMQKDGLSNLSAFFSSPDPFSGVLHT